MTEQLQSDFDKTIRNLDISDKEIQFKKVLWVNLLGVAFLIEKKKIGNSQI